MKKTSLVLAAVLLLPLAAFARGGAGGLDFGVQVYNSQISNLDLGLTNLGGYGYGVTPWGQRIGGFGRAFLNVSPGSAIAGGVGGILSGFELRAGPLVAGLTLLAGLGGMGTAPMQFPPYGGYCIAFGEATVDAGLAVTPWMLLSVYAGMQAMTNLVPGRPFSAFVDYCPVAGMRISWGWFAD